MVITFTGENSFEIAAAIRQLSNVFAAKHGVNAIERVDGEQLTPTNLPDLLQGVSLFAPARLVIIKGLAASKTVLEALPDALAKAAEETTVVISESNLDKRTKLYKFLKSKSQFKEFSNLSDGQLCTWLAKQAEQLGGEIKNAQAQYLLARAGRDQWRLASEIQKLVDFSPIVTKEAIDLLVDATPEGTAFELLDAALAGDAKRAGQILSAIKSQDDPYKLFGLLASQVFSLSLLASSAGRSSEAVAKDAKIHPFVAKKMQPLARRLGETGVREISKSVATCDRQLKNTSVDPWTLVQLCLQKIAVVV